MQTQPGGGRMEAAVQCRDLLLLVGSVCYVLMLSTANSPMAAFPNLWLQLEEEKMSRK